jgi:hypothetical protein
MLAIYLPINILQAVYQVEGETLPWVLRSTLGATNIQSVLLLRGSILGTRTVHHLNSWPNKGVVQARIAIILVYLLEMRRTLSLLEWHLQLCIAATVPSVMLTLALVVRGTRQELVHGTALLERKLGLTEWLCYNTLGSNLIITTFWKCEVPLTPITLLNGSKFWTTTFNAGTEIFQIICHLTLWMTLYSIVPVNHIHLGHKLVVNDVEWVLWIVVFAFFPHKILIPVNPQMWWWRLLVVSVS